MKANSKWIKSCKRIKYMGIHNLETDMTGSRDKPEIVTLDEARSQKEEIDHMSLAENAISEHPDSPGDLYTSSAAVQQRRRMRGESE